jgi:flagellar hook-associated protein 2
LTFTVAGVSDQPVSVTVNRDLETLVTTLQGLVDDFNAAVDKAQKAGAYDANTETPGILQGEGALNTIESRLANMFLNTVYATAGLLRLSDVGIRSDSGGHFRFDEEAFRTAYNKDPEGVERFFTDPDHGVAVQMQAQIEQMTDSDGLIPQATATLDDRTELLQERVDQLNEQLDRKRARLTREFQAMEAALAALQSQQTALSSLAALANSATLTTSSST